jgi:hypothetical protein
MGWEAGFYAQQHLMFRVRGPQGKIPLFVTVHVLALPNNLLRCRRIWWATRPPLAQPPSGPEIDLGEPRLKLRSRPPDKRCKALATDEEKYGDKTTPL